MSGVILGPNGEQIDLRNPHGGFTPEQLRFIANNAPRLGDLPPDAVHGTRSQRQTVALQQGLFRMAQDNFQLWTMLACVMHAAYGQAGSGMASVSFTQEELAKFANPRMWPTVKPADDGTIEVWEHSEAFPLEIETPAAAEDPVAE